MTTDKSSDWLHNVYVISSRVAEHGAVLVLLLYCGWERKQSSDYSRGSMRIKCLV